MNKTPITLLAGLLLAGNAVAADIYGAWTNPSNVDVSKSFKTDVSQAWHQTTDIDAELEKASVAVLQDQEQDAGHEAEVTAYGTASGHDTSVIGGPTIVSAGNDEQTFFGPAMVNNNTNQMPVNTAYVVGPNAGPISQVNTFAGRDLGPKGVFAPVGNTSSTVGGDVSQSSGAEVRQSGDSANSIADPLGVLISQ